MTSTDVAWLGSALYVYWQSLENLGAMRRQLQRVADEWEPRRREGTLTRAQRLDHRWRQSYVVFTCLAELGIYLSWLVMAGAASGFLAWVAEAAR